MNKLVKPDLSALKNNINTAKSYDDKISKILSVEETAVQNVKTAISKMQEMSIESELKSIDIEQINQGKQGIRVSLLRENGINNIWDTHKKSISSLMKIKGISQQSAVKIKSIVEDVVIATKSSVSIKLDIEDESKEHKDLIDSLYILINCKEIWDMCFTLNETYHKPITDSVKFGSKIKSSLSWTFASTETKKKGIEASNHLSLLLSGPYTNIAKECIKQYEAISKVTSIERLEDYKNKPSQYIALLETFAPTSNATSGIEDILPSELVAEIENYPLDLSYLKATLRNYQAFGCKYILRQKRVLLGDEMGLGKTVEAIGAMAALKAEGATHFMVVCPASVLVNWCREIVQHSQLEAIKVHSNDEEALSKWISEGGVAVTTYESISKFILPNDYMYSMLVVDEAHYVKNPEAIRTKAMQVLTSKTDRVLFMTGTPLENRVEEMCFIVSLLNTEIADKIKSMQHLSAAKKFRETLAPVYLRRTRENVLKELPELIEKIQWCDLGEKEAEEYKQSVIDGNFMAMRQVSWSMNDLSFSSKATRLIELCESAIEDGRKIIVFSFFRNTITKVCELFGDICLEPITGAVSPQRRQEILDEFKVKDDKKVLVAQIQAGGTGLNIQTASVVIFCEPQIKPSLETQAISRAYRMGQLRSVLVYRLLCDDTVDERITELLKEKQTLFDEFADESVVGEENIRITEAQMAQNIIKAEQERLNTNTKD